jgi:hypothetical protein
MAAEASQERPTFVLELSVIRWGIEELVGRLTHPYFPAYLTIRRIAAQQDSSVNIHPNWKDDIGQFLRVPGGPPDKPYYRPFWDQSSSADQHWLNKNLAGSWAPSSIRSTVAPKIIDINNDGGFSLKDKHWELAKKYLLLDQQMALLPLCVFLYRNFGFTTDGPSIGPHNLIQIFRADFGYRPDSDDAEFSYLYDASIPDRTDWFEPAESSG